MTPIASISTSPVDSVGPAQTAAADLSPAKNKKDKVHKLSLIESFSPGGVGFSVRYRAPGRGLYIEPGLYGTFHGTHPASNDPIGRYLGVDLNDEASTDAVADDPWLASDGFLNSLDANPYRLRIGVQGDVLPKKVFGPMVDFSFDPVQMGVAAVRGGEIFSRAFEQGEEAIEPVAPFLGDNFDSEADSSKSTGAVAAGAVAGIAGLAQSLSLGVGFRVRPINSLELGLMAGTTGLGVYRAARLYSKNENTTQAVLEAAEIKAQATWRF